MSFQRELIRKQLKELKKNNDIKKDWLNYQLGTMTVKQYTDMRKKNKKKRK